MILKGTVEDAMTDRTKKYILQNWKNWQRPTQKFKIPVRGYIQIVRDGKSEITNSDFIDFSADNFYIDRQGVVSSTLNFYGKAPFAKLSGQFKEQFEDKYKSEFTLEWIEGTEEITKLGKKLDYDVADFTGKTKMIAKLASEQMGFSSPTISGEFDLKTTA